MTIVKELIEGIGIDALGTTLMQLDDLLLEADRDSHLDAVVAIYDSLDELDNSDIRLLLTQFIKAELIELVTDFGITINDDIDIITLKELTEFLIRYESDTDLLDTYLSKIDEEGELLDTFFSLLEVKHKRPYIEYGVFIEHINTNLIKVIRENIESIISINDVMDDVVKNEAARIFYLKHTPAGFAKLIEDGFKFNYSFKVYMDELFKYTDNELVDRRLIEVYSKDIAMAVLACKESTTELLESLDEYVDDYLPTDMLFRQAIYNSVREYVG